MIVAICCTRNWYIYLLTELYALFKNNTVEKVYLFIEDDEINYLKDSRIEFINVNKIPKYIKETSPNYNTKYSKMSYIRCYFSKILNDDKVLYIDADAIVVDNIKKLWDIDLKDNALAGVKEAGEWSKHLGIDGMDDKYINSGVLLMNLDLIRKEKLDDAMINLLNNNFYYYPDQDVINITCKDKIKYISNIYNSTETTGIVEKAKIIHYIRENKGWIKTSPRSDIWYKYHNEMLERGGIRMIKVKAIREFTYGKFDKITNLERYDKTKNEDGRLYEKDTFDCTQDMATYLTGGCGYELVKVIEVLPEEPATEQVSDQVKKEAKPKKTTRTRKTKKK